MIISMVYQKKESLLRVYHVPQLRLDRKSTVKEMAQALLGDRLDISDFFVYASHAEFVSYKGVDFWGYNVLYAPFSSMDMSPDA
jgi:hypothetical protein